MNNLTSKNNNINVNMNNNNYIDLDNYYDNARVKKLQITINDDVKKKSSRR